MYGMYGMSIESKGDIFLTRVGFEWDVGFGQWDVRVADGDVSNVCDDKYRNNRVGCEKR